MSGIPDAGFLQDAFIQAETGTARIWLASTMRSARRCAPLELPKEAPLQFTVRRGACDGVWSFADHTIGRIHDGEWHTLTSGPRSP